LILVRENEREKSETESSRKISFYNIKSDYLRIIPYIFEAFS
jgi:hypothetical protein